MTKIKGWKNKFRSKDTSPSNCEGKDLLQLQCLFLSCSRISSVIVIGKRLTELKPAECTCDSLFLLDKLKSLYSFSLKGLQKNLSAFCSNMLDEYLESEAQQITERAAAFSTNPEGSVVYQLPSKSSSYVKTLDSVLKHQNNIAKAPVPTNRPCPLSYKSLLYSALASPAPPLASPATSSPADAQFRNQSAASSHSSASDASQR